MKKEVTKVWFERGKHDLEVAKILFGRGEYLDIAVFHTHQAVEKSLKGFLIYKGWKLKKVHDIELLLTEAINFGVNLQKYLEFGREVTAFYYEERYPPGNDSLYSMEEIKELLENGEELINKLKEEIK